MANKQLKRLSEFGTSFDRCPAHGSADVVTLRQGRRGSCRKCCTILKNEIRCRFRSSHFIATPLVLAQLPSDLQRQFDEAERQIVRLPPTAFPELSRKVIRELQRRGCTIPQPPSASKLHNVISGAFAKPGQTDWAVLCSLKGVSTILVFWNASEKNPAEIATMEDRTFLQGISPERIAYSSAISAVGKDFIMRHYNAYGGPKRRTLITKALMMRFLRKHLSRGISTTANG